MSENSSNTSKYLSYALMVITLVAVAIIFFQYTTTSAIVQKELDDRMELFMQGQLDRLHTIDNLYHTFEQIVDPGMESVLREMAEIYEEDGSIENIDLNQLVQHDPYLDLYIIDDNNIIIATTDPVDLNYSMKASQDTFAALRESGEYYSPRVTYQTQTVMLKKFTYLASSDGIYIFEAGYDMSRFESFRPQDSMTDFGSFAQALDDRILDFDVYSSHIKKSFSELTKDLNKEAPGRLDAFDKAVATKSVQRYVSKKDGYEVTYLYQPFFTDEHFDQAAFVLEMVYSNQLIQEDINQRLIIQLLFVMVFIFIVLLLQYLINRYYLQPIDRLLIAFKKVHDKDFSARVGRGVSAPEIKEASQTFNDMMTEVQQLLYDKGVREVLLEKTLHENEQNYFNTIKALVNAIDAKDGYTAGHCERVTNLAMMIGEKLKLNPHQMDSLRYGSTLHDIGKIGIADAILKKKGRLTDEEYNTIKTHSEIGYRIIKDIVFLKDATPIVHYHHERIDGQGYPSGLKGDQIPLLARILTIADAFDAMTSKRVYREHRMTVMAAFEEMTKNADAQFDADLLDKFIEAYVERYGYVIDQKADRIEKDA